ncbi:MAG TPA: S-layer homology domain-containing protein, partial [Chloroflexia bacterium]
GNEELGLTNTFDSILAANSATGHTYLFSSGDHGSHQPFGTRDPAPQYPASSRYVLSIGGTHFSANIGSTWPGEAAWIYQASGPGGLPVGSGGGYSELYNRPSWQVAPGFNNTRRGYPDVAAVGDPNTGMFTCYGDTTPTCAQYGGTSLSAPLWAGMLAITDQYLVAQGRARTGFVNPLLYALSANAGPNPPYHDITSGTNGAYNAGAGWDAVTGLGTPDLWNLAQALLTLPAGTPTPTQTPPPVPPTNTPPGVVPTATPPPVPPTSTPPAATATACPAGQFSDVPPGSTFYTYITDLVNKGAISGYSDCTFRPSATITRGQVAKVIVLAFGFQLVTPAQPHFSDVPPGSAFYSYIETAYARGIISGYADGTFRWSNNVTRGQLTKMVSLGRSWRILTPAQPTFRDVPPTETFYSYIETTYAHGVISGYDCGTGCLEFRSSATSTRGQGAKIIDLSIYAADNTATPTTAPPTVPPTNTPPPGPTNTPAPTDTPAPTSTSTPVPPTATQTPTNTPSPTSTPTVRPTDTPQPAPYLTGFQPNSVEQYDTETQISMTGNWFGMTQGAGFVVVNGRVVTVDTWDNTLIRFRITTAVNPATPATVRVVRDDGQSATSTAFSVTPRQHPYIFSYSPSAIVHGDGMTVVTASGIQFGTTPGTVTLLGTYPATIVSWSNTQIQFRVDPNTPAANPISVIVNSPQNGSYTEFGRFAIFP